MIASEQHEPCFHYVLIFHFKLFRLWDWKKICSMFSGILIVLFYMFAELYDK